MKQLLYLFLYYIGVYKFIRFINRNRITIISYHAPSVRVFREHIKYLHKHYVFMSMDDLYEILRSNRHPIKYGLVVTFDDGHKSNVDLLPIFKEYKIRPVIYCCSQVVASMHPFWWKMVDKNVVKEYKNMPNVDRLYYLKEKGFYTPNMTISNAQALSRQDIDILKEYVTFGSHTRFHPILTQCSQEEQKNEIVNSKYELEKLCGTPINHFAYPNGNYNDYSVKYVREAGYATARTTDVGWNDTNSNMYTLKVLGISDDANLTKLRFQISGLSMWIQYLLRGSLKGVKQSV